MSTGIKVVNTPPSGYVGNFKQTKGNKTGMVDRDSYVNQLENQLKQYQNKGPSAEPYTETRNQELTAQISHLETKINNLTKLHKLAQNLQEAQENETRKDKENLHVKISELEVKLQKSQEEKKKMSQKFNTLENLIVELIDKRNNEKKTPKKDSVTTDTVAKSIELIENEFRAFRQSVADRLDSFATMLNNQSEQREQDFERISLVETSLQKEINKRIEHERELKRAQNEPGAIELIHTVNRKLKTLEETLQIQIKPDLVEIKRSHDTTRDELYAKVTKIEAIQQSQNHKVDTNLIRSLESQANVFQKEISYLKMKEKKHFEDINSNVQDLQDIKQSLKSFQNYRTENTNSWKHLEKKIDNKVEKFTSEIDNLVTLQKQLQEYYANSKYEETNAHLKQEQRRLDEQLELCISKINTLVDMHNQTRVQLKDNYRLLNQLLEKEKLGTPIAASSMSGSLTNSGKKLKFSSDIFLDNPKEVEKKDIFEKKLADMDKMKKQIKKEESDNTKKVTTNKPEVRGYAKKKKESKPATKDPKVNIKAQQTPSTDQKKRQKILRDIYKELQELETSEDDIL